MTRHPHFADDEPDEEPTYEHVDGRLVGRGVVADGVERQFVRLRCGRWIAAPVRDGRWEAELDGEPLALRGETADGEVVKPPLPYAAEVVGPLEDATDPCVGCDAVAWDHVEWAGGEECAAVCRRCGRQVRGATPYAFDEERGDDHPSNDGAGEDGAPPLSAAEQASWDMLPFADARFPVYGLDGEPQGRRWVGSGSRSVAGASEVSSITLGYGAGPGVTVETSFDRRWESPPERLREGLEQLGLALVADAPWPESALGAGVRFDRLALLGAVVAELALVEELAVAVDGAPTPFLLGRCGGSWMAHGVLEPAGDRPDGCALTVTVTGRDVPFAPFALTEVQDIAPFVGGGRESGAQP